MMLARMMTQSSQYGLIVKSHPASSCKYVTHEKYQIPVSNSLSFNYFDSIRASPCSLACSLSLHKISKYGIF